MNGWPNFDVLGLGLISALYVEDMLKYIEFQAIYGKSYANKVQNQDKFEVLQSNLRLTELHNEKGLGLKMGVYKFSDKKN